jgi:RNA polymerase sigma-70 factor, ECF subfamily
VVSANMARDRCQATAALKRGGGKVTALSVDVGSVHASGDFENRLDLRLFLDKVERILAYATAGPSSARDLSVFWLHYRQGFTAREIAAIPAFHLTDKGVESLLLRLVRHVRSELAAGRADHAEGSGAPKSLA